MDGNFYGRLFNFSTFMVGAYSRGAFIKQIIEMDIGETIK